MTSTTATFDDVRLFDGRSFPRGDSRRIVRHLLSGAAAVLGTVAATGAAITIVTVTASWFVNTALVAHPNVHASAPFGPAAVAFAGGDAATADGGPFARSARLSIASTGPLSFEAKWARTMALAAGTVPPALDDPFDSLTAWASLQPAPQGFPSRRSDAEIADAVASPRVAELAPAVIAEAVPATPPARPSVRAPMPETASALEQTKSVPLPRPSPAARETPRQPAVRATPQVAMLAPQRPAAIAPPRREQDRLPMLPGPDSRTAVYDIAAHTVYLPNGQQLEAHSGLGDKLDDPRYVSVKNRGPTPPNVYELKLREQLFHDVRAIRLTPVDGSRMFGRDGMLAHTYMLGPNGQSNGCVSFRDYQAFLRAFLRGEINRLVVVPRLGNTRYRTADAGRSSADWSIDNIIP